MAERGDAPTATRLVIAPFEADDVKALTRSFAASSLVTTSIDDDGTFVTRIVNVMEPHVMLCRACWHGDIDVVTSLLAADADMNHADMNGFTPLFIASKNGHTEIVMRLIAAKAEVDKKTTGGCDTPLLAASQNGHTEIVIRLIAANANVNEANKRCETPLFVASKGGHTEVVTTLIAAKADAEHVGEYGNTPLYTASQNGHTDVVTTLLAANAEVGQANNEGATPLIVASRNGHTETVTTLLAANSDVQQAENHGYTPMHVACASLHVGVVELLSSYGASRIFPMEAAPCDTAEHLATHSGTHRGTHRGNNKTTAFLVRSRLWSTPLHHLEVLTPTRALELLLAGADVDAAAQPGGPTPRSRARELCASGAAAPGSAAHVVLEWADPWSRATHKFYPPAVRARVAEVMLIGQRLKRSDRFIIIIEVWEAVVVKHIVASAYWR